MDEVRFVYISTDTNPTTTETGIVRDIKQIVLVQSTSHINFTSSVAEKRFLKLFILILSLKLYFFMII